MTKFIEVTDESGEKLTVNIDCLHRLEPKEMRSSIFIKYGNEECEIGILESYDEVKAMLGNK